MNKIILLLISFWSLTTHSQIITSGNLSVENISPAWNDALNLGTLEETEEVILRNYTIKSSIAQTLDENVQISGDTNNFIVLSNLSSDCKMGFNFTGSNTCILRVRFQTNNSSSGSFQSSLNLKGLVLNLTGTVSLKISNYKIQDINGREVNNFNFNTLFAGESNLQTRTVYLKDLNKSSLSIPSISLDSSNFTLSHSCTLGQINSTSGCAISANFNSSGKSEGNYNDLFTLAGNTITLQAQVNPLINKGSSPSYYVISSNGDVLTSFNFGSVSKFSSNSSEMKVYLKDANRVVSSQLSYSMDASNNFSSSYSTCSASILKGSVGCLIRTFFLHSVSLGSFNTNLNFPNLTFNLSGVSTDTSPHIKSPNYVIIDNASGKILNSLLIGSYLPNSSSEIKNYKLIDLNSATFPENIGVSFSGLSGDFNLIYNQCTNSRSIINSSGCLIKITANTNQTPGSYSQTLDSNLNFQIPVQSHILGNTCTPNSSQSCLVSNGQGSQICNSSGTSYGSCNLVSCNENFHEEEGFCVSDTRSCSINNGTGVELWMGNQWSYQCNLLTCNNNFHPENNNCVADVENCPIENGTGERTWGGTEWGSCLIATCNAGFHKENEVCVNDISPYFGPLSTGAAEMVYRFNATSNLKEAEPLNCLPNYYKEDRSCVLIQSSTGIIEIPDENGLEKSCSLQDPDLFFISRTNNKSLCRSLTAPSLSLNLPSSENCPANYTLFSTNPTDNTINCRAKLCTPNTEIISYKVMKNSLNEIKYLDKKQSNVSLPGFNHIMSCERTCNADGLTFSDCETVSCEGSGLYFNRISKTCEEGEKINFTDLKNDLNQSLPIEFNNYIEVFKSKTSLKEPEIPDDFDPTNDVYSYKYTKFYLKIKTPLVYVSSFKIGRLTGLKCNSYSHDLDNGIKDLECFIDPVSSIGEDELKITRDFLSGLTKTLPNNLPIAQEVSYPPNNKRYDRYLIHNLADTANSYGCGGESYSSVRRLCPNVVMENNVYQYINMKPMHSFTEKEEVYKYQTHICGTSYRRFKNNQIIVNNTNIDTDNNGVINYFDKLSYLPGDLTECKQINSCYNQEIKIIPVSSDTVKTFQCSGGQFLEISSTSCLGDTHLENGVCVSNQVSCNLLPESNALSGVKFWTGVGDNYTSCHITECLPSFHIETDNFGVRSCIANEVSCSVGPFGGITGVGTKTWNNHGYWNSCILNQCQNSNNENLVPSSYHIYENSCTNNQRSCEISNGVGQQNWDGTWGECEILSCNSAFHKEFNVAINKDVCVSNTRQCLNNPIGVDSGLETWVNGSWGNCVASTCSANYHLEGGSCIFNTQSCPITKGQGEKIWSNGSYGTCTVISCNQGYENINNTCVNTLTILEPSNNLEVSSNQLVNLSISGGVQPYSYSTNSTIGSLFLGGYLTGNYEKGVDFKLEQISVTDFDGVVKSVTVKIRPNKKICSFDSSLNPLVSEMVQDLTGESYGDCYISQCTTEAALYNQQCYKLQQTCNVTISEDPNIDTAISQNGLQDYVGDGLYSSCYSNNCKSESYIYPYGQYNKKCEKKHICSENELVGISNLIQYGNYIKTYETHLSKWKDDCFIDRSASPESECKYDTENNLARRMKYGGINDFCYTICPDGQKEVWTSSTNMICKNKRAECNDLNVTYTGSQRVGSTDCDDHLSEAYVPYPGNYFFKSLPSETYPQAKCYDGSQGGFLYRPGFGSGRNRWIIMLQGGGACGWASYSTSDPQTPHKNTCSFYDLLLSYNSFEQIQNSPLLNIEESEFENLLSRVSNYKEMYSQNNQFSNNILFNNNPYSESQFNTPGKLDISRLFDSNGNNSIGILSISKDINPDFFSWNHIILRYCSQDLWTGNGGVFNNQEKFNGYRILRDSIHYLKNHEINNSLPNYVDPIELLPDLDNANNIIIGGYSAGGEGIYYLGEEISSLINNENLSKDISFLVDSGSINNFDEFGNEYSTYLDAFKLNVSGPNSWNSFTKPNSSPSHFIGTEAPVINNLFFIQDTYDFEFLNYNPRNFNAVLLSDPTLGYLFQNQGKFKEFYICNSINSNNFNIDEEWTYNYENLKNYTLFDFNIVDGNLKYKLFNNYDGIIYDRGRHGMSISNDWSNSSFAIENKKINQWFSEWYFNKNNYPEGIKKSDIDTIDIQNNFELYLKNVCNSINNKRIYLDKQILEN